MKKKVTHKPKQSDVAALAGVSQTTVSLVLNDKERDSIPDATRQNVLDAIETLGYVPNSAARILRTSRTYALACIIPDITNPFYPTFVSGIQAEAEQNGYEVIIYNTHGLAEKEAKVIKTIQEGRVDGMIGVFFHTKAQDFLPLMTRQTPVVRLEVRQNQSGKWPLDSIYIDNVKAAHTATSYLMSKGHKQIALLTGGDGPARARREGYLQALQSEEELYMPWIQDIAIFNEEGGYEGMQAILKTGKIPSALFAGNDLVAIGAMQAIKSAGLRIPEDVAVVGFDDIRVAKLISPSLTTIRQAQDEIGKRAASLMIERLQREDRFDGRVIEMPFELIIRESA